MGVITPKGGNVMKKRELYPVVSKFGGLIVTILSQSATKFQPGNFNNENNEIMAAYRRRLCVVCFCELSFILTDCSK